jgi:hypothetical protein
MDKRKSNGGARKGAGRKPKAKEVEIAEQLDDVADLCTVFQALYNKVQQGDTSAIKLWLSYRLGMPIQQTDITTNGQDLNTSITPISFVTTDND